MNKAIICSAFASLMLFGACVNNQKEKNGHPADKNPIVRNDNNKADAMPAANIDEEAILKAGFRSEAGLPLIVDFSAAWCGPCRQFKPIFHETAANYAGKVDFLTVDVDSFPKFAEKYGIEAIPTVIYFDASGKELNRTQGFIGKEDFNAAVNQLLQ